MDSSSDEEFFDCQTEPIKYYAVACQKDKGKGIVTMDIGEARNKLKHLKGSRFSSFYDPLEAMKFAEKPLTDEVDPATRKKPLSSQKKTSDPFPNVATRDLNALKAAIECGNLDKVKQLVWSNPRHLVTESDSPTLLQVRFRHNALHVAATFNQAAICEYVLDAISRADFWHSLYPTADERSNQCRMQRVIDMYLNAPEVGFLETPLHLASKFGHRDVLRALLSRDLTDTSLRNKCGCRADEVVCQRYTGPLPDERVKELLEVFSEKFVVLLDTSGGGGGGCQVVGPLSHCRLLRLLRQANSGFQFRPVAQTDLTDDKPDDELAGAGGVVRAYIGPLPDMRARQVSYRWSVLNAEDATQFEEIRRTDAEKGMEVHGRFLAALFGAQWRELWQFLACGGAYADLATDDGLGELEEHLGRLHGDQLSIMTTSTSSDWSFADGGGGGGIDCSLVTTPINGASPHTHALYGSLVRLFSRLTIRSPSPASPIVSPRGGGGGQLPMVTSTPVRPVPQANASQRCPDRSSVSWSSLRVQRTPFNSSLLGAGILTTTDRQVRRAVLASQGRHRQFPRVSNWLDNLSLADPPAISDLNQLPANRHTSPFASGLHNGFLAASTPLKSKPNRFKKPLIPDLSKCLSPLSHIELPD